MISWLAFNLDLRFEVLASWVCTMRFSLHVILLEFEIETDLNLWKPMHTDFLGPDNWSQVIVSLIPCFLFFAFYGGVHSSHFASDVCLQALTSKESFSLCAKEALIELDIMDPDSKCMHTPKVVQWGLYNFIMLSRHTYKNVIIIHSDLDKDHAALWKWP